MSPGNLEDTDNIVGDALIGSANTHLMRRSGRPSLGGADAEAKARLVAGVEKGRVIRFGVRCRGGPLAGIHQLSQCRATAREARAYRADRYADDCSDIGIGHAFESDEQDDLALLDQQLAQRAFQVAQLKRCFGVARRRMVVVELVDRMADAAARHRPAHVIDMLVMHQGKEPASQIGARLP